MKLNVRSLENSIVLDVQGRIDIDSANLIETVGAFLRVNSLDILCNLEDVEFVDYMGVSVIAIACKNVLNHHGRFILYNVPVHVRQLFQVAGLEGILEICSNEEEALKQMRQDRAISEILKKKLRRKFKRLNIRIPLEYKQTFVPEDQYFKGKIINLSAIGAFVIGEKCFSLGDVLTMRIFLTGTDKPFTVSGRVVWMADKQLQRHVISGFGVEFSDIDQTTQNMIFDFIERNLADPI